MQTQPSKPIPTSVDIAPRGMSFHGQSLKQGALGLPFRPNIGPGEYALIAVLTRILMETMDYPLQTPISSDSFLPENLVEDAQQCLGMYGLRVPPNPDMLASSARPGYYPERDSESPYDVSIACSEIDQINGLMTDRQTVELLTHVLGKTGSDHPTYNLLKVLIQIMAKMMRATA